jgi:hypothetical protein
MLSEDYEIHHSREKRFLSEETNFSTWDLLS